MVEQDVVCALRDKQAEVRGLIERLEQQLVEHRTGLSHLEGVLRLFDPSLRLYQASLSLTRKGFP
jgi:hypothetical protein